MMPPIQSDMIETAQALIEGLREGIVFATRDPGGELRFHHVDNRQSDDAVPMNDAIAELSRYLN